MSEAIGLVERLLALRSVSAFGEFPDHELAVLASNAEIHVFAKSDRLMSPGDRVRHLLVPVRGELRVTRGGEPVHHQELTAGIGMLSMLGERPSNLAVSAATRAVVMLIRRSVLSDALDDDFQMSARLLRRLSVDLVGQLSAVARDRMVPEGPTPDLQIRGPAELDLVERLLVLRPSQLFRAASLDGVAQFAKMLAPVSYPKGALLWRQRDPSDGMLVVVEGVVCCATAGNKAVTRYQATGLLGAIDVLSGDRRWASARCETSVRGLWADREVLLDILEDNFELTVNLLRFIASRAVELRGLQGESPSAG